ncbi:hypothetical protein GCM10009616_36090 [Microlunatus lacustris]
MTVTSELVDRLRRHYIKPGQDMPGGVFVPEVGLNSGGQQRRCDAVYVGFTSASGRQLVGHEVKISRADWRHELDQPDKSATWWEACHAWYVVAPSTAIVPTQELPPGWGLMVPNARSKNRMDIVVRSDVKPPDHQPPWLIVRSILARLDTLQQQQRWQMRQEEHEKAMKVAEESMSARARMSEPNRDSDTLDQLEQQLQVNLRGYGHGTALGQWVQPSRLAEALAIVYDAARLDGYRGYHGIATQARELAENLERLGRNIEAARQPAGPLPLLIEEEPA